MTANSQLRSDNNSGHVSDLSGDISSSPDKVQGTNKRTVRGVCDICRIRRVKCDYQSPCQRCQSHDLTCTRDYVPRKRGPKRGHGRVIKRLKGLDGKEREGTVCESSADFDGDDGPLTPTSSSHSSPSFPVYTPEVCEQYRPTNKSYLDLVTKCVQLYYDNIYHIMPLLYMPDIWQMIQRPLEPSERTLIYALSAKTCFHMRGKSLHAEGPDSWEKAGRFFLEECEASRKSYDYVKDVSLSAVISSFWMSTSSFEINDDWKSEWYMREALNFALGLRLHIESSYEGLRPEDALCRRRAFWQLFVTERSLAIFRRQDILLRKTPQLPTHGHPYESPEIHSGFLQLISAYMPLDESFVRAWNDGPDPSVGIGTFLGLQNSLAIPPSFVSRPQHSDPSSGDDTGQYEPTIIQKADLLITQQWLRLTVWRSSAQRFLLSRDSPHESMRFAFPLTVAHRTASILKSLPSSAVEVHGMGIFEKIFEIGRSWMDILTVHAKAGSPIPTGGLSFGMDFADAGSGADLGLFGLGRRGITIDPLEFFISILSSSPDSKTQFAGPLLQLAHEKPGALRMALSPALHFPNTSDMGSSSATTPSFSGVSVIGEVDDTITTSDGSTRAPPNSDNYGLATFGPTAANVSSGAGVTSPTTTEDRFLESIGSTISITTPWPVLSATTLGQFAHQHLFQETVASRSNPLNTTFTGSISTTPSYFTNLSYAIPIITTSQNEGERFEF